LSRRLAKYCGRRSRANINGGEERVAAGFLLKEIRNGKTLGDACPWEGLKGERVSSTSQRGVWEGRKISLESRGKLGIQKGRGLYLPSRKTHSSMWDIWRTLTQRSGWEKKEGRTYRDSYKSLPQPSKLRKNGGGKGAKGYHDCKLVMIRGGKKVTRAEPKANQVGKSSSPIMKCLLNRETADLASKFVNTDGLCL